MVISEEHEILSEILAIPVFILFINQMPKEEKTKYVCTYKFYFKLGIFHNLKKDFKIFAGFRRLGSLEVKGMKSNALMILNDSKYFCHHSKFL